jgi:hypothetical protein
MRPIWTLSFYTALFVVAAVVAVYLAEATFWLTDVTYNNPRPPSSVVRELREQGKDAWPSAPAAIWRRYASAGAVVHDGQPILPLSGIANALTVLCDESGHYAVYQSDFRGFRNDNAAWNKPKIAILGDSFAQGACVDEGLASFVGGLNLGMGGNGPLAMLAGINEYLQYVRPPVVLWLFFEGNDLGDLENEEKDPVLTRYLSESGSQNLLGIANLEDMKRHELNRILATLDKERPSTAWRGFFSLSRTRAILRNYGTTRDYNYQAFETILQQAKTRIERWHGKMIFAYLAGLERYMSSISERRLLFTDVRPKVLEAVHRVGLPVIDTTGILTSADFYRHYNEAGHRKVGLYISEQLRKIVAEDSPTRDQREVSLPTPGRIRAGKSQHR